ncbi:MAG: response regulator [Acidimicrobiales bacterium]
MAFGSLPWAPWPTRATSSGRRRLKMAGLQAVIDNDPEVVVLDLGLPDIDGGDVLRMIRAVSQVPVMIATARDDDDEIVRLLDVVPTSTSSSRTRGPASEARTGAARCGAVVGPSQRVEVGGLVIDTARVSSMVHRPISTARSSTCSPIRTPRGRGGEPPGALRRGLEAALRRSRQDDRRAPVVAPTEARGDRSGPALPPHRSRRGDQARRTGLTRCGGS